MTQSQPVQKGSTWQGIVLVLINMLPSMAIVCLMPALPTLQAHFKDVLNKDLLIPLILTAPGLCIALIAPFAGYFIDKFGRRQLLIVFLFLYGLGGVLPVFLDGFNAVITGRLLLGIGEAFVLVIANTLLGDYFAPNDRAKWLTIQSVIASIMVFIFLNLSGYLASLSWNYPFLVYGLAIVMSVLAWFFIYEPVVKMGDSTQVATENTAVGFPTNTVIKVFIVTLLFSILYFVYTIHFSLVLDEIGIKDQKQIGSISAIASLAVPLGAFAFKLVANRPIWQQIAMVLLGLSIGLIGIGQSKDVTTLTVFALFQQLACGMTIPVLINWALKILPVDYRGRGMGFWNSGFFLGQFLNPFFMASVRGATGSLLQTFTTFGIVCLVAMGIIIGFNVFFKLKNVHD